MLNIKSKLNLKVIVIISIIFVQTANSLCPNESMCNCDPQMDKLKKNCPQCETCPLDLPQSAQKICPKKCSCVVRTYDQTLLIDCSNKNLHESPILPNFYLINFYTLN